MESGRMAYLRNPNNRVGRAMATGLSAAAALALFASGCGSSAQPTGESSPKSAANNTTEPTLTFDDLGGGSSVIEVFPSPRSDTYDGTYYDGDRVTAICKAKGQERHSDPSAGELNRQSDEWIRIIGTPGEREYATAVYVENPQRLLDQLSDCSS